MPCSRGKFTGRYCKVRFKPRGNIYKAEIWKRESKIFESNLFAVFTTVPALIDIVSPRPPYSIIRTEKSKSGFPLCVNFDCMGKEKHFNYMIVSE